MIWSEHEDNILRRHLDTHGRNGLWHLLPNRTPSAIDKRAVILGLRARRVKVSAGYPDAKPIPDDELRRYRESLGPDTRDLTARLCGDPLPGRSAYDRLSNATGEGR